MNFMNWIEAARFHLMNVDGAESAVFMHRVSVFDTNRPLPGFSPAAIGVQTNGDLTMVFCWPLVKHLTTRASAELLKHEVLHYVFGHLSERTKELREVFGKKIVGVAVDLVVNQHINVQLLAKEGLPGVTIDKYELPPNMTTAYYCQKLKDDDPKNPGSQLVNRTPNDMSDHHEEGEGKGGELTLEDLLKAGGESVPEGTKGKLIEIFVDGKDIDETTKDDLIAQAVQAAIQEVGDSESHSRGWGASEAVEWIKRLKRKSVVRWTAYLKKMESRHMNVNRVSSKRRPSRRHPAYFGRVKRMGAEAWFAIDTSGSMGKAQLQLVDPELRGLHYRDVHLTVIHCDAGVARIHPYDVHKGIVEFAGRGGTDFSPVFEELDKIPKPIRPAFLVFYTDGYGCCSEYLEGKPGYEEGNRPVYSPGGVETLWLLPAGCCKPKDFKELVPFGHIAVVPKLNE